MGASEAQASPMARGLQRMGTALRTAHAQDFVKKRKPELGAGLGKEDDSDEDEGEEEGVSGEVSDGSGSRDEEREIIGEIRDEVEGGRGVSAG